ncbi:MAG: FprA family A-type flavoprotein [Deltaproteobacteria bacterium]|nr:FprA family A-type flavoprotein [Deltaproteobacteria bacterium]
MQPIEVKENIYWVGAIDWNVRDFHGYQTPKGTTYNSFLVLDEKVTLFDCVKKPFKSNLLANIRKLIDPAKIDYIVVNHVEMDHSGALPEIMEFIGPEKVICSPMGKKVLIDHFHREDWPFEVVESGKTLSLGKKTVQFLETRMLHWPDSMFSYLVEDEMLISSDAFGQHWATSERFDDEVDLEELLSQSAKYYANILLLYSPLVQKLLAGVRKSGLRINMIAPDHGLIWRSHPGRILEAYDTWSQQKTKKKALLIYDTMWQSTEAMANAIADGLNQEGVDFKMLNLKHNHRSDVMTEVLDSKAIILGSSTLNNGILPGMADILCYMKGLKPTGKIGAAFGSYGWSGESVKILNEAMEGMKIQVVDEGIRVKFAPTQQDLDRCIQLGRKIGKLVKENGH